MRAMYYVQRRLRYIYIPLMSSLEISFLAIFFLAPIPGPEYGSSSFSSQLAAGILLRVAILSASLVEMGFTASTKDACAMSERGRGRERIVREVAGVEG